MGSTITFNSQQIATINTFFGQAIIPTSEKKAQAYLGSAGDEVLELWYDLTNGDGAYLTRELRSDQISSPEYRCTTNAAGEKIEPACGDSTVSESVAAPLDQQKVLTFMAAISNGSEISAAHRGSLDQSKVTELRNLLGLTAPSTPD